MITKLEEITGSPGWPEKNASEDVERELQELKYLVTVRREIALPPAVPKLNVKVSLHSATQCMVVVIDTLPGPLCMPGVMAVAVEGEFVTQFFSSPFAFGHDVIYFYEISWSKVEFTPSAFSLLLL